MNADAREPVQPGLLAQPPDLRRGRLRPQKGMVDYGGDFGVDFHGFQTGGEPDGRAGWVYCSRAREAPVKINFQVEQNPLPVAILAGGLATRLGELTQQVPKALLEINGEPFLAHQLRLLYSRGIRRAVLCVGHLGEKIREYAGSGKRFGIELDYSFHGPTLRGTAGAIHHALPLLGDPFFVMYGDSYLTCDYSEVQAVFEQ